jgi:flagellar biosynthesis/type III secretory pathway ATPase
VEGDDMNDPVADAMRSLLDGHVVLTRELAWRNHYPCIDILASVSRLMPDLVPGPYVEQAGKIRDLISTYQKAEDMINIGAYVKGSNPKIDLAIRKIDTINAFLRQRYDEGVSADCAMSLVTEITQDC